MKILIFILGMVLLIVVGQSAGFTEEIPGNELFDEFCVMCHPDGSNKITPDRPLFRKSLESRNIKTTEDIIKIMRNPGKGMLKFSKEKLSDDEAKKIAEYIQETFK